LSGLRGRSRAAGCRLVESRGGGARASRTNDVRRGVVSTGRRRSTHAIFTRMTSPAAPPWIPGRAGLARRPILAFLCGVCCRTQSTARSD